MAIFLKKTALRPELSGALFAERSEAKKRERSADKVARKILYYNFTLY